MTTERSCATCGNTVDGFICIADPDDVCLPPDMRLWTPRHPPDGICPACGYAITEDTPVSCSEPDWAECRACGRIRPVRPECDRGAL